MSDALLQALTIPAVCIGGFMFGVWLIATLTTGRKTDNG